jgi:ABC-type glycerol-3-phosphate transport system substrate-binding protein
MKWKESDVSEKKRVSRRDFLRMAAGAAGLAALSACQPEVVYVTEEVEKMVTQVVKETVEVEKMVEVEKTVEVEKIVEVAAPAEVDGTLWVLQKKDFFPAMNDWFRAEVLAFCKEKDWPVDVTYEAGYTGGTPFLEKMAASAAAGTPADLLMHSMGITEMRRLLIIDPVTDIVEEVAEKWGAPSARQEYDYYVDDQWFAVPYFQRSDGGWFQRPPFEDAGIDIHSVRTYPDLWEACLEVSNPDEQIYGWGTTINRSGDGDWFRNRVMHGWGAYLQDETGQYVTIDSPEMVEAITAMTNIYIDEKWAPMLPPGILAWTDASNNEAYLAGRLAYTQNGGTVWGKAVLDGNPIKDVTGFHAPCGGPVNEEFNSLSANNFMLLKGAKNQEAARELMLHFLMPLESQDAIFSNAPAFALPAYEKLWEESNYIPDDQVAMEQKPVATDPNGWIVPASYPGPAHNPALAAANEAGIMADMVSDILRGTSVADAVKTCHDRYVAVFQEFGLPGEET